MGAEGTTVAQVSGDNLEDVKSQLRPLIDCHLLRERANLAGCKLAAQRRALGGFSAMRAQSEGQRRSGVEMSLRF